ncbi:hypothetical protein FQR65_LT13772 [Abscondita terminalis]|nr:hypothetical protein FQR65_LT13772 [Abscondita terminalis]
MVYGLLNRRIRKRISRETISTFSDLLRLARTVEQTFDDKRDENSKKVKKETLVDEKEKSKHEKSRNRSDTGAIRSVMGYNLFKLLEQRCKFESSRVSLTMADGIKKDSVVQTVTIKGKTTLTEMIVLLDVKDNNTLLGEDVLSSLGIILDVGKNTWYFRDSSMEEHQFVLLEEDNSQTLSLTNFI